MAILLDYLQCWANVSGRKQPIFAIGLRSGLIQLIPILISAGCPEYASVFYAWRAFNIIHPDISDDQVRPGGFVVLPNSSADTKDERYVGQRIVQHRKNTKRHF